MTTEHELDEILRRAMHAAVDSVEPAGDGLQRIRRKLEKPGWQLQLQLWLTECADLARLIGIRLAPAASAVSGAVLTAWAALPGWFRRPGKGGPAAADSRARRGAAHRSQPPGRLASLLSGLRPALAVAAAVVVVVAGVFGLFQLRQGVTSINLLDGGGQSPLGGPSGGTTSTSHSGIPGVVPSSPRMTPTPRTKGARHHSSPAPTCTPRPSSQPQSGTPSAPPVSPTPTDTATATPSPTDSTSPSPSTAASSPPPVSSGPPVGLNPSNGPVQSAAGCYSTKAAASNTAASSPSP